MMKITVTGRVIPREELDHGVDGGRFWHGWLFYLYPLAWDPFILTRLGTVPAFQDSAEDADDPAQTILLSAHPNTHEDLPRMKNVLAQGGHVVLNHPPADLISALGSRAVNATQGRTIVSLRERWHFGGNSSRPYIYPHLQPFLQLDSSAGDVLSRIGGNPDLLVEDRVAVFAGNPIEAAETYQFMPDRLSDLMGDLATALVHTVARFTRKPLASSERRGITRHMQLRRDFHAFGFATLTVLELDRCHGGGQIDLSNAFHEVLAAARALPGSARDATAGLQRAFAALERENRKLQPSPAIFTDTLHGGELYPDIGYFEIDWPEHPADVIRTYLDWAEQRSYRFNVDLGATTVREMAMRFPDLFERVRRQQARGRIEFVNGSCNQPYPPFHSLESQMRQFDVGRQVWADVLKTTPVSYASQEFGFCPQMAAVLKQQGFTGAVVRVQNMGDAPTMRDEVINWRAPSGDRLRSLPSHPHKSEQRNEFTYNNLHLKLALHGRDGLDFAVFTCLGDITFHRPMREELIRVCHYAPVFGRFETFRRYFRQTRGQHAPETALTMADFNCDAAFINLDIWKMYKNYTGNYNSNCVNSMTSTNLFAAAELIDAAGAVAGNGAYREADHERNWEALTHYQGHGTYIVPYYMSGGFQGTGDSPENHDTGRGCQAVAEYLGPVEFRQVKQVTDGLMHEAKARALRSIRDRLGADVGNHAGSGTHKVFSFAPQHDQIVRVPGAAGKGFTVGEEILPSQDDGTDSLVLATLPSYGAISLRETDRIVVSVPDTVEVGSHCLENALIRAEFDVDRGILRKLIRKSDGRELLGATGHAFYFPGSLPQICHGATASLHGPLRGSIEFDIQVRGNDDRVCRLHTRASLDANSSIVNFMSEVHQAPEVEGNQWNNHLGVQFQLTDASSKIWASHFNVIEPFDREKIFSPNVLLARSSNLDTVILNQGNQFYVRKGDLLSHILIMENESARRFRYAIGAAAANPIMQGRQWALKYFVEEVSPSENGPPRESLVDFSQQDVELLSCREKDGDLLLRLANTCGRKVKAMLGLFRPIKQATITSLAGKHISNLVLRDGRAVLPLRPWDVRQVRVKLD